MLDIANERCYNEDVLRRKSKRGAAKLLGMLF